MSGFKGFLSHRLGWDLYLKPFLYKKLPSDLGWSATLGSLCALVFVVEVVTGMLLAMYYNPSPDLAYESIQFIMNDVSMGNILRGIHHWGASAMVILVFTHLMTVFFSGSYKTPRELTWTIGVFLFLFTLGLGFTGYLLPWDQKAYWATVVSSNIPRDIPLIGDYITRIMLGGDRISGLTLTRFYSLHMLVLPSLLAIFVLIHIYLIRIHGLAEHPVSAVAAEKPQQGEPAGEIAFYPEHLFKCTILFTIVFGVILALAFFAHVPLEDKVGTIDDAYLPRPDWYYMWLFQILTFFSGSSEVIGSLVIPLGGVCLLFLMPWLSKNNLRGLADRPLATAMGTVSIIGIVYLTLMGFAGARPYGQIVPVPDRTLTPSETVGLAVFVARDCAYCHNIHGKGGRTVGPDLTNMPAKKRTDRELIAFIRDPQSVSRWSIMPKYDLTHSQAQGIADFILALDFSTWDMKIIHRDQILSNQSAGPDTVSLNHSRRHAKME
ncbi:cytochrome b N-terminal domain-containing protein [bacterium]|nr:cytochrome b N-terminal domain-containing protein [bacterium]